MNIQCLKEFDLGIHLEHVRSVSVSLGKELGEGMVFVYSEAQDQDPWQEGFNYPKGTLKMAVYTMDGLQVWKRNLGWGAINGVWYTPFITFDLDGDGIDEIWLVNNPVGDKPFSLKARVLERIDPVTGAVTGSWPWPESVEELNMSHAYRFYLIGGYVHDTPVLVTAQGCYRDMFLQCYNPDMGLRWELSLPPDDGGCRSCHSCPVLDFDEDGIDELFWGERVISLDDGRELYCGDRGKYFGHSDVVLPFVDDETGKKYIFTCREDDERPGVPRVVTYNEKGERVWIGVDEEFGHMHHGWIANIGPDRRKIAMALRYGQRVFNGTKMEFREPKHFYFDAITGEEVESPFPYPGSHYMPIDFNGDGYHEFYSSDGLFNEKTGYIRDRFGKFIAFVGGTARLVRSGKIIDHPGEQLMLYYPDERKVRVWGDADAVESEYFKKKFAHPYHTRMQHFMGAGYNHIYSRVTCAMT